MPIEALLWSSLLGLSPALAFRFWPSLRERFKPLPFDLERLAPWIHSIGLPFLALILGSVSPRHVGLQGFASASWLSGSLACALGLGASYWVSSSLPTSPDPDDDLGAGLQREARWAFYRGAAAQWLPYPFGSLAGLGLAILELAITHLVVQGLHPPSSRQCKVVLRAALSALIFLGTGNAWLTAGTQLLLTFLLKRQAQSKAT